MTRALPAAFALLSVAWAGWTFASFVGWTMGDCDTATNAPCALVKEWAPRVVFWRWLAIQLILAIACMTIQNRLDRE